MITGMVKYDEGRIRIKVRGFRGREREVEAVIDTGYTGSLTLPSVLISPLGLRFRSVERACWPTVRNAFLMCITAR
jgi:predicted aspartyl protease